MLKESFPLHAWVWEAEMTPSKNLTLGDQYLCVACNICTPNDSHIGLQNRNNKRKLLRKVKNKKKRKKGKLVPELPTNFLPCRTHLLAHWNKSLKALFWSHSGESKIIIFYLWTTVCLLWMATSSSSVQSGSAATWRCGRNPGPVKDVRGYPQHLLLPCP